MNESELSALHSRGVRFPIENIGTRIGEVANLIGSRVRAAEVVGVSVPSLQRYIAENAHPPFEAIARLAIAAGVSMEWIATGEGEMRPTRSALAVQESSFSYAAPTADFAMVPLLDVHVSTGHGATNGAEAHKEQLAFRKDWLRNSGLEAKSLLAVTARGDSMVPVIKDGDTLLVDTSRTTPEDGRIYVLRIDDHLYAKRLQVAFDGTIRLISENKAYQDQVVSKADRDLLNIIGRVVWVGAEI